MLSQGPRLPGVAAGTNWTTPLNVLADDAARAIYNAITRDDLRITDFKFTVPLHATIVGIEVHHQGQGASATAAQRQVRVGLTKDGTALAGSRKTGLEYQQDIDTDLTSGGDADLWGTTWTPTEVNASTFGVLLSDNDLTAAELRLDVVDVKIYYTLPVFPASPGPEYPYIEEVNFRTLVSQFEGRQEQRRRRWGTPRRGFRLTWKVLTASEVDTLFNFYIARSGAFEAFAFVNLNDSVEYTCRFSQDQMSKERFSGALFTTGLELLETNG